MRLVVAIIQRHKLDEVKRALAKAGIRGMTVTDVKGFGLQGGRTEHYRGTTYVVDLLPKTKIEIATPAAQVESVIKTIVQATRTGNIGDGKIFVLPLEQIIRIRTGESGHDGV